MQISKVYFVLYCEGSLQKTRGSASHSSTMPELAYSSPGDGPHLGEQKAQANHWGGPWSCLGVTKLKQRQVVHRGLDGNGLGVTGGHEGLVGPVVVGCSHPSLHRPTA